MSACKYCGAEIVFFETATGSRMPVNPRPDARGNVVLERAFASDGPRSLQRVRVLKRAEFEEKPSDEPRFMPHAATCSRPRRRRRARFRHRRPSWAALLLALFIAAPAGAGAVAGPPAPRPPHQVAAISIDERIGDVRAAEAGWRWYAGAWAIDAGSTVLALARNPNAREVNPVFGDRPGLVIAAKAAAGAGLWRLEVFAARRGERGLGRFGRWFFLGLSIVAGGHNITVAW